MPSELDKDDHDRQQHHIAEVLERAHPSWMVLWGSYSRMFWAFPLSGPSGSYFAAPDPHALNRRIKAAEMSYQRIRQP